jgi:hypothetical protein
VTVVRLTRRRAPDGGWIFGRWLRRALAAPVGAGQSASLQSMTRPALNQLAASLGIADPAGMPNKDAVIAAIAAAQGGAT